MKWHYLRVCIALAFAGLILSGCRGGSGIIVGLSDDELRSGYGPEFCPPNGSDENVPFTGGGSYDDGNDEDEPPTVNHPPTIERTVFADGMLNVIASDPDGDTLQYRYVLLSGEVVLSATGEDNSILVATLLDREVAFEVEVTVKDPGWDDDHTIVAGATSAKPPENSIWVLFDRTPIGEGDTVTVTVYAYKIAHPMKYVDSVMVEFYGFTVDTADGKFDVNTLNLGAPGGAVGEPDGIWAAMPDGNYGFFAGAMSLFGPFDAAYYVNNERVPAGRKYFAVNVSPFFTEAAIPSGSSGALFNFTMVADGGNATFKFIHEYRSSDDGSLLAGTLYSSSECEDHAFFDEQMLTVRVGYHAWGTSLPVCRSLQH